ncbi:MAG: DNA-binding protein [Bacteroidetes bacterium HGW-Bacteroidetes-6]|jgi:hypothetical protein|nr:MAG: DNA-binding protein [Bacteroidetes bacterium HGW-Bacteroidetes-6]
MEDFERKERDGIYAKVVRAGKRTYFFDVKEMRSGEMYITVTESKKRFNQDNGRFFYEKHKLFLYKEDFDKFANGLEAVVRFIRTGEETPDDIQNDYINEHEFIEDINNDREEN